ncbi:MAG TPA: hypothetical protein VIV60_31745, partial [Polyangiaceae bacterium]
MSSQQPRHDIQRLFAWACVGVALTCAAASNAEPLTPAPESQPETVELSWVRSPDADVCLSGSDLKAAVRARLGRDPFTEPFQKQIEGYVSRHGATWFAEVTVREHGLPVGSRHLESTTADCRELDQAVSLTLTLIIDPNAALHVDSAPSAITATHQTKAGREEANTRVEGRVATPSLVLDAARQAGTGAAKDRGSASAATPLRRVEAPAALATRLLIAPSFAYQLLPDLTTGVV